jgi:hypothetical protein
MPDAAATSILVEVMLGDGSYEREGLTLFMSDFDQVSVPPFPERGSSAHPVRIHTSCSVPV